MSRSQVDNADLVVRDADMEDVPFIAVCNMAMALETERKILDRGILEKGIRAVLAQPDRGFYLMAVRAGVDVGCLLVTHEWSDWRNGDWWWLQSVYVVPEARRGGVFRALHAEVDQRARAARDVVGLRLYVEKANAHAQTTYESMGMAETCYRLYERSLARE